MKKMTGWQTWTAVVLGVGLLIAPLQGNAAGAQGQGNYSVDSSLNFYKKSEASTKSFREIASFTTGTHAGTMAGASGLVLNASALQTGFDSAMKYNGASYYYGSYTSQAMDVNFMEAIPSWQANTPPGTWTEVEMSALVDGVWSKWYTFGAWLEGDAPFKRHSFSGQGDAVGTVATDTLMLAKQAATAVKVRVTLFTTDATKTPSVRNVSMTFSNGTDSPGSVPFGGLTSALDVPKRSQMVFPDGGPVWCSPTSTSMVMSYWAGVTGNPAYDVTVRQAVAGVWDYRFDGGGNWPYNTAYASSLGLVGKVARLSSFAEVEKWTAAGVPVIASIAYKKGELDNSPISSTDGHLLVVRGFDAAGNVLTNDPAAASDEAVTITYDRVQLEKAWLDNSNGTVYLIYPQGWSVPAGNGHW